MIRCQATDCFNCPYPDCIGTVRCKRGRPKKSEEEKKAVRKAYNKKYYAEHREELKVRMRENYRRRCAKKEDL